MSADYDNPTFFDAYASMDRSKYGLDAAGEWHELKEVLPDFTGKTVLYLGCGYGWHCRYAANHGAKQVIGIDNSEKMIQQAQSMTENQNIAYKVEDMFDLEQFDTKFDVIISSLAIHYIEDYTNLSKKVYEQLSSKGVFVMSVEHPVFTAEGSEQWITNSQGENAYWPVDRYFDEKVRETDFLGFSTTKYHRTITTYVQTLLQQGFTLDHLVEPKPPEEMLANSEEMQEELRRPMMLILAVHKAS
ncbi:class I SAM-dependent methyltransferase [Tetragenococcus osmophilus]|uniref:SAM-dependent methyltransferase n=3 Tax=Tetragenococcus TaxID=51668 RepID=A0AA38CVM8_9ENTE|nr:class I SAM-dependent methyltransferase [Tetragenococcus osmophilus]AYW47012.1 class I SAM-dependent methyltransferase [Tetragenococcus osmophilus]GMA71156.1 SAM-dependent methyltransferase [Tetragenococcus osmophilus]